MFASLNFKGSSVTLYMHFCLSNSLDAVLVKKHWFRMVLESHLNILITNRHQSFFKSSPGTGHHFNPKSTVAVDENIEVRAVHVASKLWSKCGATAVLNIQVRWIWATPFHTSSTGDTRKVVSTSSIVYAIIFCMGIDFSGASRVSSWRIWIRWTTTTIWQL